MIKIERKSAPGYLKSNEVDLAIEKLEEFYSSKNRDQKRYDFPFNRQIDKSLISFLQTQFHSKCAYCESKLNKDQGVVDRFRPHNGVRDKKEYYPDLYWWLTFEWDNLVYSCKDCNQYKANYFPVSGARVKNSHGDLLKEKRLLLNPCFDDPNNHFTFRNGEINSDTSEGIQTIELLNLNRTSLVNKRKDSVQKIKNIFDRLQKGSEFVTETDTLYLNRIFDRDPTVEFLFAKRIILLEELDLNPFARKYILNDHDEFEEEIDPVLKMKRVKRQKPPLIKSDYFPIEYVRIKNFKGIVDLKIEFPEDQSDGKAWLFLLGENAAGKSSILQAIAIGIRSTFKTGDQIIPTLIRDGKNTAQITVKERDRGNVITTTLDRRNKSIKQTGRFNSYLLGYGSLRLSSEEGIDKGSTVKDISYENLFIPIRALNDSTHWLKQIFRKDKKLFDSVAFSIKQLMPHDLMDNQLTVRDDKIVFKGSKTPFSNFSDGYKSTITLALDIMMKLSSGHADMNKISGIVLIDELGNQLHPRWQMRIVNQLRLVFPKITFIVSTHHPLCLRGAEQGETLLLKRIKKITHAIIDLPNPAEFKVDQLLASEFFGLSSLMEPEMEVKFNRYYELLSLQDQISDREIVELSELKEELKSKRHLGESLREELMYSVIDNLLARKVTYSTEKFDRNSLKRETIDLVRKIWHDNGV